MSYDYDLIVIGCGPAGEKAAVQAAYFGKRVAVIEKSEHPGGAAVHTGTLPSKTLRETALFVTGYRTRDLYGISMALDEPRAAVSTLIRRKNEIAASATHRMRNNLRRHGVELIQGIASLTGCHEVHFVRDDHSHTVSAEVIVIATGSSPYRPPGVAFEDIEIYDSDEILEMEALPRSMVVVGGGVIGCEYACMFAALGVDVTIVDKRADILPFLDREVLNRLRQAMQGLGIRFVLESGWTRIDRTPGGGVRCELDTGETVIAETLLYAAGRSGNSRGLGLESLGIEPNRRGQVPVNEHYQTAVESIYAIGDVIGFPALASTSMEQGRVAMCHAFELDYRSGVSTLLPYGIYTIPEVSTVGLTEEECRDQGIEYVIGVANFSENERGMISGDVDGMTKLVAEPVTGRLLGVHVVGLRASELVHIGQSVMHFGGSVHDLISMVFNYPTLAESYKYAAYAALGAMAKHQA